ncbi:hypothetical protein ACFLYT_01085, partial [Nanoarchaeota archaeon]
MKNSIRLIFLVLMISMFSSMAYAFDITVNAIDSDVNIRIAAPDMTLLIEAVAGETATGNLDIGYYRLLDVANDLIIVIEVTENGTLAYDLADDGILATGFGTDTIKPVIYPITADRTDVDPLTIRIHGIGQPIDDIMTFNLPIRTSPYLFSSSAGGYLSSTAFWISRDGTVTYDASYEGITLRGAGTTTVELVGHPIDVTISSDVSATTFVKGMPIHTGSKVLRFPIGSTDFKFQAYIINDFGGTNFRIDDAGVVDYDPSYDGVTLNGLGTSSLELISHDITFDATELSFEVYIRGIGGIDLGSSRTFNFPGDFTNSLMLAGKAPVYGDDIAPFKLDADGNVVFNSSLEGVVLEGLGTQTIKFIGIPVVFDTTNTSSVVIDVYSVGVLPQSGLKTYNLLPDTINEYMLFLHAQGFIEGSEFRVNGDGTCSRSEIETDYGTVRLTCGKFPITLDGTDVDSKLRVWGYDEAEVRGLKTYFLEEGNYNIYSAPGGTLQQFSVLSDGTIDYDSGLDNVALEGLGTSTIKVIGHEITLDGTETTTTMQVKSVDMWTNYGESITMSLPENPNADYTINSHFRTFETFKVLSDGTIDYDSVLDDVTLEGLGTSTIKVLAKEIVLDGTDVSTDLTVIGTLTTTNFGGSVTYYLPVNRVGLYTIHSYTQGNLPGFSVLEDGTIEYDSAEDGVSLTGLGTSTVKPVGYPVSLDLTDSTADVTIYNMVFDYTSAGEIGTYNLPLLPTYKLYSNPDGDVPGGEFTLNADGSCSSTEFTYDHGTIRVVCGKFPITLDATAIDSKAKIYGYAPAEFRSSKTDYLEEGDYTLYTYPGGDLDVFSVDANGKVQYDAALDGVTLEGLGTSTIKILGHSIVLDGTAIDSDAYLTGEAGWAYSLGLTTNYGGTTTVTVPANAHRTGDNNHYRFTTNPGGLIGIFTVDNSGNVVYDSGLDNIRFQGLGTDTMKVLGHTVTLDGTGVNSDLKVIGLNYHTTNYGGTVDVRLPGDYPIVDSNNRYRFYSYPGGVLNEFHVDESGIVVYDAILDGVNIEGLGTSTIKAVGYPVALDLADSTADVKLYGMGYVTAGAQETFSLPLVTTFSLYSNPGGYVPDGEFTFNQDATCSATEFTYDHGTISLTCGMEDSDGDGVGDDVDNCVDDANPDQEDNDGDGIGNVCDPDTLYPINLDLTGVSTWVKVGGRETTDAGTVGVYDLLAGTYSLYAGPGGVILYFSVLPGGTVDFDAADEGVVVNGLGTDIIEVLGYPITVDKSGIDHNQVFIYGFGMIPGTITYNLPATKPQVGYTLASAACGTLSDSVFGVGRDGLVDYDPAQDGVTVNGLGTSGISIIGYPINVDVGDISTTVSLAGTYNTDIDGTASFNFPIDCAGTYRFYTGPALWHDSTRFSFDGTVSYDPAFDGVTLNGQGTDTVEILSYPVTLDATAVSTQSRFGSFGWILPGTTETYNLAPEGTRDYEVFDRAGNIINLASFDIDLDGNVVYDVAADGVVLEGLGTSTIKPIGTSVRIDASDVSIAAGLAYLGGYFDVGAVEVLYLPADTQNDYQLILQGVGDVPDGNFAIALDGTCSKTEFVTDYGTIYLTCGCVPEAETCDGVDNDCDGVIDNGGDSLCDNGLWCDGAETCDALLGCQAGTPEVIDDGVSCTDDSCDEVNDVVVNSVDDLLCDDS